MAGRNGSFDKNRQSFMDRSNAEEADRLMRLALEEGVPVGDLLAEANESLANTAAIMAIIEARVKGVLTFQGGFLEDLEARRKAKEAADFVSEEALTMVLRAVGEAFDRTPNVLKNGLSDRQVGLTLRSNLPMVRSLKELISSGHDFFVIAAPDGFKLVTANQETPESTRNMVLTQQAVDKYAKNLVDVRAAMVEVGKLGGKLISSLDYKSIAALRPLDRNSSSWLQPDNRYLLEYSVGKRGVYNNVRSRNDVHEESESYFALDLGWRIELFVPFK